MSFKYSVCYPNKANIAYFNEPISKDRAFEIAEKYPWEEQVKSEGDYYSPSLDFTNIKNSYSFCLTAVLSDNNELSFSLWFNRPKKVKVLFGLLGQKEKMVVDDYWSLDFKNSLVYLDYFLNGDYNSIEKLYR